MSPKLPTTVLRLPLHRPLDGVRKAERARIELASVPVVALQPPSFTDQRRALRLMLDGLRDAVGSSAIGDCFAFGLRNELSATAMFDCLDEVGLERVRRFSWACSLPAQPRGGANFGWADLNGEVLRDMRSRHRVRRVSLVLVGNDFVPSSVALLNQLESLLADQVLWVVCRQSAAPAPDAALADLSSQTRFSVLPVGTFQSAWLALRLRRLQAV